MNPRKCGIGKISKYFLEHLNSNVREVSLVNQWQETSTNIKNKNKCIFTQLDIEEFYPLKHY